MEAISTTEEHWLGRRIDWKAINNVVESETTVGRDLGGCFVLKSHYGPTCYCFPAKED